MSGDMIWKSAVWVAIFTVFIAGVIGLTIAVGGVIYRIQGGL